jgi:hypothetical protein
MTPLPVCHQRCMTPLPVCHQRFMTPLPVCHERCMQQEAVHCGVVQVQTTRLSAASAVQTAHTASIPLQ